MEAQKYTCVKLELPTDGSKSEPVFVKGTWSPTRFDLSISNGLEAWTCHATEEEVQERASQWDQTVSDYVDLAERYLGFQQPGSVYGFSDAGNGCRRIEAMLLFQVPSNNTFVMRRILSQACQARDRQNPLIFMKTFNQLSWTFEKNGTKLEWRWKCQPSPDSKKITAEVLDFLMDANIRLSEEVVWKTQSFDRLKVEAEKCLAQSDKLSSERLEFESEIYGKFTQVLNSKKAKLRELRGQLSKQATPLQQLEEEEESTDKTETFDEGSDEEPEKNEVSSSKDVRTTSSRGRKRKQ